MTEFMDSDLVVWIQTFWSNDRAMKCQDLSDGIFLNSIFKEIDPSVRLENIVSPVEGFKDRLKNWEIFLQNILNYYMEVLQQVVTFKPPNIVLISKEIDSAKCQLELRKALLLLLGAAVQCENKDLFINQMLTQLHSESVQSGIMECIKEIMENEENVVRISQPEGLLQDLLVKHLCSVSSQRDHRYLEELQEMANNIDSLTHQINSLQKQLTQQGKLNANLQLPSDKNHLNVELAECKAKIRKLSAELDEKTEQIFECNDEIRSLKEQLARCKEENQKLSQDVCTIRVLRDEVDCLREKAALADRLETENSRLIEKLNDMEYYKARCEELREDMAVVVDDRTRLMEQIERDKRVVDSALDHEQELAKSKLEIERLQKERENALERVYELVEEVSQLQAAQRSTLLESANLEAELERAREIEALDKSGTSWNLSDQLANTANTRLLRLEVENRQLKEQLDKAKNNTHSLDSSSFDKEQLERENHRLQDKLKKIQDSNSLQVESLRQIEKEKQTFQSDCKKLKSSLDTLKENYDRQLLELSTENEQLTEMLSILQNRSAENTDDKFADIERENTRLHQTVNELNSKLAKLDFEHRQLGKSHLKAQESASKVGQMELENDKIMRENKGLQDKIESLKHESQLIDELEDKIGLLEREKKQLEKNSNRLQSEIDRENMNLKEELRRVNDTLKRNSEKLSAAEYDRDELQSKLDVLQDSTSSDKSRLKQLEGDLLDMDTENQKLQRQVETLKKKIESLQNDLKSSEEDQASLHRELEKLRLNNRLLEEADKSREKLQSESYQLSETKASLEREVKRLKQNIVNKEHSLSDLTERVTQLEQDNESLVVKIGSGIASDPTQVQDLEDRIEALEKENRSLVEQLSLEKKTESALRAELIDAKIRCQQLVNERDQVNQELESIGLNREKLQMAQDEQLEQKYQALESMMETTVKETIEKKQEIINSLESRLEESKSRNLSLSNEITRLNRETEAVKQRYEEELETLKSNDMAGLKTSPTSAFSPSTSTTKHLIVLKDRLVDLERENAKLETQMNGNKIERSNMEDRLKQMEASNAKLQEEISNLRQRNADHLAQNASLQVEVTTLRSQVDALQSQNGRLTAQYNQLESEHSKMTSRMDLSQSDHVSLINDHKQLTRLHERLTNDYERLSNEATKLRSNEKSLQKEVHEKSQLLSSLQKDADSVKHLKEALEREKDQLKGESRYYVTMEQDYRRLQNDHSELKRLSDKNDEELRFLRSEVRSIKTDRANINEKYEQNCLELSEARDMVTRLTQDAGKLKNECETFSRLNQKLEEEKRSLLVQIQSLINQNQELLTQTLENKEHHHAEELSLRDRLNDLQRQKERLEEKIMEQYKTHHSPKKNRGGLGSKIFSRLAKRRGSKENLRNIGSDDTDNKSAVSYEDLSQENDDSISGPVPRSRVVSHHSETSSLSCYTPGSVSKFDRSPDEVASTAELRAFLSNLNQIANKNKQPTTRPTDDASDGGFDQSWQQRSRTSTSRTSTPISCGSTNPVQIQSPHLPSRNIPMSQPAGSNATTSRRQLPMAPHLDLNAQPQVPMRTTSRQPMPGQRAMSVPPERMMRFSNPQPLPQQPSGPPPPARKASLPVTDRMEKQIGSSSGNQPAASPPSQSSSQMVSPRSSFPTSTPESASSRAIYNRLSRKGPNVSGLPQRPATVIDFMRSNSNPPGQTPTSIITKQLPQTPSSSANAYSVNGATSSDREGSAPGGPPVTNSITSPTSPRRGNKIKKIVYESSVPELTCQRFRPTVYSQPQSFPVDNNRNQNSPSNHIYARPNRPANHQQSSPTLVSGNDSSPPVRVSSQSSLEKAPNPPPRSESIALSNNNQPAFFYDYGNV